MLSSSFRALLALTLSLAAAAPARAGEIEDHLYVGVDLGIARVPEDDMGSVDFTKATVLGPVRFGSLSGGFLALDMSAWRFAKGEDETGAGVTQVIEGVTFDLGVGVPIGPLYLGVIPYAWAWASDVSDGLGLIAKVNLSPLLLEAKVVPLAYFEGYEYGVLGNNSAFSVTWFASKDGGLAIGARYNQLGNARIASLTLAYGQGI